MPNYKRLFVPGGSWFFTVNLEDRNSTLLVDRIDDLMRATWLVQRRKPFRADAWVVLPNHLHAVWTLPPGDSDFSARWRDIKGEFSKSTPKGETEIVSTSRQRQGERGIWQRRFWEHLIRDERDYGHHIDYCWYNPVKHGLVSRVEDWPHSSYHRDHEDYPRPGDFERALTEHASKAQGVNGER